MRKSTLDISNLHILSYQKVYRMEANRFHFKMKVSANKNLSLRHSSFQLKRVLQWRMMRHPLSQAYPLGYPSLPLQRPLLSTKSVVPSKPGAQYSVTRVRKRIYKQKFYRYEAYLISPKIFYFSLTPRTFKSQLIFGLWNRRRNANLRKKETWDSIGTSMWIKTKLSCWPFAFSYCFWCIFWSTRSANDAASALVGRGNGTNLISQYTHVMFAHRFLDNRRLHQVVKLSSGSLLEVQYYNGHPPRYFHMCHRFLGSYSDIVIALLVLSPLLC